MKPLRLNVLISAHELNPYGGSECAEGWNVVTRLGKYHNVTVLYARGSQRKPTSYEIAVKEYLKVNGNTYNINFIPISQPQITNFLSFINKKISKNESIGNPFLYYLGYSFWQKKAYEVAKHLCQQSKFDIVHHLTSISFREPGLLWKLNIPFVWGPTGGLSTLPFGYFKFLGYKTYSKELIRNSINRIQFFCNIRIMKALENSSLTYTFSKEDELLFYKRSGKKSKILLDAAAYSTLYNPIKIQDRSTHLLEVVWCGELIQRKSLEIIFYAIKSEPFLQDKIRLKIIGGGPLEKHYKSLAQSLDINFCIDWIGKVERKTVFSIMEKSDLLVHSSYREGTSHVIVEALTHGMPVICHDINGMSIAVNDDCGIKVPLISPERSIQGFKEALVKLVKEPEVLKRLKTGALNRSKELSWDNMVETIANDYITIYEKNVNV